jgi:hypothetical protein
VRKNICDVSAFKLPFVFKGFKGFKDNKMKNIKSLFNKKTLKEYFLQTVLILTIIYALVYDFFTGLFHNNDFLVGVWVEFHGFLIEAVLIIVLLSYWTKRQEAKKIKPVMDMIVAKADRTDGWINTCFDAVISGKPDSLKRTQQYANYVGNHLIKFTTLVELNSSILGANNLPLLVKIIDLMEEVKLKIKFISNIYDNHKHFDFIILEPLKDLQELRILIDNLCIKFKFERGHDQIRLQQAEDINLSWLNLTKKYPIHTDPTNYKPTRKNPYFYDIAAFKVLNYEFKDGTTIKVFKQH